MPELIRALCDLLQLLWPLRSVWQWQKGVYYVCGRYWRTVGPGVWPVVPWFIDVRPVNVVPAIHATPLQTITLRDGRFLVFSATVTSEVDDPAAAWNRVEHWSTTTIDLVSGLLSDRLGAADPLRFDTAPGLRDSLVEELRSEADAAASKFGVRVLAIRFPTFAVGVRAYRLLGEQQTRGA